VAALARHFGRSPSELVAEHVRKWQVDFIEEKRASASARNQHVAALRFLHSVTRNRRVSVEQIP
jgi:hypothetical protein